METLIKQLTKLIENSYSIDSKEASGKALKEIVLSGLSRSGFLKVCPYLSAMDIYKDNTLYLLFLNQKENLKWNDYLQVVRNELEAAGAEKSLTSNDCGFTVEYSGSRIYVFVYQKDFDLKSEFFYQQQPISYEMRKITEMLEGIRSEIENALNAKVFPVPAHEKKKKESSKGKSKAAKNKKETDQWVQPSLFDF